MILIYCYVIWCNTHSCGLTSRLFDRTTWYIACSGNIHVITQVRGHSIWSINNYNSVHTVIATFKHACNTRQRFCTKVLSLFYASLSICKFCFQHHVTAAASWDLYDHSLHSVIAQWWMQDFFKGGSITILCVKKFWNHAHFCLKLRPFYIGHCSLCNIEVF